MPRNRMDNWLLRSRDRLPMGAAWCCALLALLPLAAFAQTPPSPREAPLYITNQTSIVVPFEVAAGTTPETQPAKVNIYVSLDRGNRWDLFQTLKPTERSFQWTARRDAEFWFATQVVDRLGRPNPFRVNSAQLRLIVDTQRPQLKITGGIDAKGELTLDVAAVDANLKPGELKLEWQSTSDGRWFDLPLQPTGRQVAGVVQGIVRQPLPDHLTAAVVRAEAVDAGGNKMYFSRQFLRPKPQEIGVAPAELALQQRDPAAQRWNGEDLNAKPPGETYNPMVRVPAPRSGDRPLPNQSAGTGSLIQNPFTNASRPALPASRANEELLPPPNEQSLPEPANSPSVPAPPAGFDNQYQPSGPVIAPPANSSEPPARPNPEALPPPAASRPEPESLDAPSPQHPRLTNSKRFSLEYDVESVGPEGIADVELWGTNDNGRSWMKWGTDPDRESPFDVEVANETQYGFRIVVVGKNGLASNTPKAGDGADIWIGVDVTRPDARLTGAIYGSGAQAGKLQIRWTANDPHLGPRPITLLSADNPAGPYSPIAAGLPNSGEYWWEYDPRSPRELYLRLEVRDSAGNLAVDQLSEPIKIEGLAPKARIRSILPGAESAPPRSSFVVPLFR